MAGGPAGDLVCKVVIETPVNLTGEQLDSIPRSKGSFLWSQIVATKRAGCDMLYVAMFDEVDEGTAIFKCTNTPPIGNP